MNYLKLAYQFVGYFKDGVLWACDDMCERKRGWRNKGDTWWWNEELMLRTKAVCKTICRNSTEYNKNWYDNTNNKSRKVD